jgi:hypothetical protein
MVAGGPKAELVEIVDRMFPKALRWAPLRFPEFIEDLRCPCAPVFRDEILRQFAIDQAEVAAEPWVELAHRYEIGQAELREKPLRPGLRSKAAPERGSPVQDSIERLFDDRLEDLRNRLLRFEEDLPVLILAPLLRSKVAYYESL